MFVNLDAVTYWSLLGQVDAMVGNSSSGIMEAASFALPVVNVGMRQQGRERGANVIDVAAETDVIRAGPRSGAGAGVSHRAARDDKYLWRWHGSGDDRARANDNAARWAADQAAGAAAEEWV